MQRAVANWRRVVVACVLAAGANAPHAGAQGVRGRLGAMVEWKASEREVRASVRLGEDTARLSITAVAPDTLRIQAGLQDEDIEATKQRAELEAKEDGDEFVVRTAKVELRVRRDAFGWTLQDDSGNVLLETAAAADDGSGGVRLVAERMAEFTFVPAPNEHFYGLGEKFNALDQRGREVQTWIKDAFGSLGDDSYVCVPFLISSRGYGLWLDSDQACRWDLGANDPKRGSVAVAEPRLDLYLMYGPDPADILNRFTALSGRPALPPRWAFLPWVSRDAYQTQQEVLAVARRMAELRLPCGVIVVEGWKGDAYGEFAGDRFPDPAAMLKELHELGMRCLLYVLPVVHPRDPVFRDAATKGFFVLDAGGQPARLSNWLRGWALVDFTNSEAVEWWQELYRPLLELGVDGFKTGDGEAVLPQWTFADGRTGREMHNLYPNLFHEAMFELVNEEVEDGGIVWGRSGTTGVQQWACVWAGDQVSDFEHLRATMRAGLSAGMSGIPFWGHDIGGYWGRSIEGVQRRPTKELFIRWLEFGAFSPIMQLHGRDPREPWTFDDETLSVYRRCAMLRANLVPYIYTSAVDAANRGMPLMRPLALAFPNDPRSATVDDEFLFGPDLLVAPVCQEGATAREVYLPPGVWWFDFWENTVYDGGQTIHREADLDSIPLFVRAGAVIPMELAAGRAPGQSAEAPTHLTFDIYPFGESRGRVRDGDTFTDVTCERRGARLDITVGRRTRPCWLRIFCSRPRSVKVDGADILPEARAADSLSFWRYDNSTQRLLIRLGGTLARDVSITGVPGPTIFANITFPQKVCSSEASIPVEADIFNLPVAAEPMLEWDEAGRPQPARTGVPMGALRWKFRIPLAGASARERSLRFRLVADVDRLTFPAATEKRRITLLPPIQATALVNGSRVVGSQPIDVEVRLQNHCPGDAEGTVALRVPEGAVVKPNATLPYAVPPSPASQSLHFDVTMPPDLSIGEHMVAADIEWLDHDMGTASTTVTNEATWAVIGPFPNDSGKDFRTAYPPEKSVDLSAQYPGKKGPVRWRVYPREQFARDGFLDFLKAFPGEEWAVAYAVAYVDSPGERTMEVRVGHDDAVIVWLNGDEIISREVYQEAHPDQAVATAKLREGRNVILVKLCQLHGEWKLYFRLTGPDGLTSAGLRDAGADLFGGLPPVSVAK